MKGIILSLFLLPLTVQALERVQSEKLLADAAAAHGKAYVEARSRILGYGKDILPILSIIGADDSMTWQQRLVARISYERIERVDNIQALRRHDWRQHPGYDLRWEGSMTGPGWKMDEIILPYFSNLGLWYYYIEISWKDTDELAVSPLKNINNEWIRWGRKAVIGQPEARYMRLVLEERLRQNSGINEREATDIYMFLCEEKQSDSVPVLIRALETVINSRAEIAEPYSGAKADSIRSRFIPLLSIADSRHAEMLEKFIDEHAAFSDLKPRLAEVRARPAPPPKADPPFRLGTTPVKENSMGQRAR